MDFSEFATRLGLALVAGLIIGFERQWNHHAAGLRTNALVAFGSASFVLLTIFISKESADITHVIGQVVTGIGFLGAGIIYKEGLAIHGLTTAVTVWCTCGLGCMAAAGFLTETAFATAAIVIVNVSLRPIELWLTKRNDSNKP